MKLKIIKSFAGAIATVCVIYGIIYSSYRKIMIKANSATVSTISIALPTNLKLSLSSDYLAKSINDTQKIISKDDTKKIIKTTSEEKSSFYEYLSKLYCNGCSHNCLLIKPRCSNGRDKVRTARTEFFKK